MKTILIEITFDDEDGYKGHGDNVSEMIIYNIETFLQIDLQDDDVIKEGWSVNIIKSEI